MNNLKQILITHARRYPLMEPTDAVKLIYQNEFGGGHLIRDEAACLNFLHQEYGAISQCPDSPLTEYIGNGLVRVHLAALDAHGCSPENLGRCFIRSAVLHQGSLESFLTKLELLRTMAAESLMPFSATELEGYLVSYQAIGYPMVSHSETYRQAYHPGYRIVLEDVFILPEKM